MDNIIKDIHLKKKKNNYLKSLTFEIKYIYSTASKQT
jgi:hypothetical protein